MKSIKYHKDVISLPRSQWSFFDYVEGDANHIEDWFNKELTEEAQFMFEAMIKDCSKIRNHLQWVGFRGYLRGKFKDEHIWELGFIAGKRQYRVLGIFEGQMTAVLLLGCYHKGRVYTPPSALDTAHKRAKALHPGGIGGRYEREIDTNL